MPILISSKAAVIFPTFVLVLFHITMMTSYFKDYLRLSILNFKGDMPDALRKERMK